VPRFIPLTRESAGTAVAEGGHLTYPCRIHIYSPTQGASIVYRLKKQSENARWLLYTQPVKLEKGENILEAKAVRIGYKESETASASFDVI